MSLGLGAIPWVVMGEIFPEEAKDKASSLVVLFQWLCAFVTSKFVKNILEKAKIEAAKRLKAQNLVSRVFEI